MKAIKKKDLLKFLKKQGAVKVREGKGSHTIYKRGPYTAGIPMHKEISPGTIRDICKNLNLDIKAI